MGKKMVMVRQWQAVYPGSGYFAATQAAGPGSAWAFKLLLGQSQNFTGKGEEGTV